MRAEVVMGSEEPGNERIQFTHREVRRRIHYFTHISIALQNKGEANMQSLHPSLVRSTPQEASLCLPHPSECHFFTESEGQAARGRNYHYRLRPKRV